MKKIGIIYFVLLAIVAGSLIYLLKKNKEPETAITVEWIIHQDETSDISFIYPTSWGEVSEREGNQTCPEEDTYRTGDTLSVFDREIGFTDIKLEGSESFARMGVRVYELDLNSKRECQDAALIKLYQGETAAPEFDSAIFERIEKPDFFGFRNRKASRLNTEGREQYTLFSRFPENGKILVVQPYVSFIPYFDSPELNEMEKDFGGDMSAYLEKGRTSAPVRTLLTALKSMSESLVLTK